MSRSRRTFLTTVAAASVTLPLAGCAAGDEQSGSEETNSMNDKGTNSIEGSKANSSMDQENEPKSIKDRAMTESMTETAGNESVGDDEMNDGMTGNETAS